MSTSLPGRHEPDQHLALPAWRVPDPPPTDVYLPHRRDSDEERLAKARERSAALRQAGPGIGKRSSGRTTSVSPVEHSPALVTARTKRFAPSGMTPPHSTPPSTPGKSPRPLRGSSNWRALRCAKSGAAPTGTRRR
jgi:hypothetical protein